jgi:hypothetical protein
MHAPEYGDVNFLVDRLPLRNKFVMNNTPGVEKKRLSSSLLSMAAASLSLKVEYPLTAIRRFASWYEGRTGNTIAVGIT